MKEGADRISFKAESPTKKKARIVKENIDAYIDILTIARDVAAQSEHPEQVFRNAEEVLSEAFGINPKPKNKKR